VQREKPDQPLRPGRELDAAPAGPQVEAAEQMKFYVSLVADCDISHFLPSPTMLTAVISGPERVCAALLKRR
jgi:hypothetical protein